MNRTESVTPLNPCYYEVPTMSKILKDPDSPPAEVTPNAFVRKAKPAITAERMLKMGHRCLTIRLWVPDAGEPQECFDELAEQIYYTFSKPGENLSPKPLAALLMHTYRLNAVEVIDMAGNGVVLYADWP